MKKFLFRALMASLIFILALILFLRFWNFDIPEQDFSDMMPMRRNIPQETNAYYVYREVYSKITDVDRLKELAEQENPDNKVVEEFLKENEEALALIDKGLEMDFEEPDVISVYDETSPWREWGHLFELSLFSAESRNEYQRVESLIEHFCKSGESTSSISVVLSFHKRLLESQLKNNYYRTDFDIESIKFAVVRGMKGELELQVQAVDELANMKESSLLNDFSYFLQPNSTKQWFYLTIKESVENVDRFYKDFQRTKMKELDHIESAPQDFLFEGNYVGFLLAMQVSPNFDKLLRNMKRNQVLLSTTEIKKAIVSFMKAEGKYPKNLEELMPLYLKDIPIDPFDGESLRYIANKKQVYSVGRNLIDDGGELQDRYNDREGDIVIDLYLPKLEDVR